LSIALVRVDDRLVHGQVLLAWGAHLHPTRYLIADDALAASEFEKVLLEASGGEVPVEVLSLAGAAERVANARPHSAHEHEAVVVLVKGLAEALGLARAVNGRGGRVAEVNLGGLHYAAGKERVHDYVYLDDADRASLGGLARLGVRVFVQDVPASRPFTAPPAWASKDAA
jgi:PTS system mannose-specific IIB component/fructoselysine and glucoselysine-specific PTS system IIB component